MLVCAWKWTLCLCLVHLSHITLSHSNKIKAFHRTLTEVGISGGEMCHSVQDKRYKKSLFFCAGFTHTQKKKSIAIHNYVKVKNKDKHLPYKSLKLCTVAARTPHKTSSSLSTVTNMTDFLQQLCTFFNIFLCLAGCAWLYIHILHSNYCHWTADKRKVFNFRKKKKHVHAAVTSQSLMTSSKLVQVLPELITSVRNRQTFAFLFMYSTLQKSWA